MDFILNSKTKKVEIFYNSAAEQQAILEFLSKHLTYKEEHISHEVYINNPGIAWTSSTTPTWDIKTSDSMTGTITLDSTYSDTTTAAKLSSTTTSTLDTGSDEGGYSCITAYVPRPSKTK